MPKKKSLSKRFWPRVQKTATCWLWTGPLNMGNPKGRCFYGHIRANGTTKPVTHAAWFLTHGKWPKQLNHKCDNCGCVNPEHLYEGTQKQNIADRTRRGRHWAPRGSDHPRAKLNEKQVKVIRAAQVTQRFLAEIFGVSERTIQAIKMGKVWKHLIRKDLKNIP